VTLDDFLASRKLIFAFLLLVTFVVFGNTFCNEWTYDDIPVVMDNSDIRSLENFRTDSYPGRPLRELSYMLDYQLFGENPAGYHLQQNLWHAANACLLFLVMTLLGIAPGYALFGTLLFLLHPIQTESVASIGHRKELLPLFFGFCLVLAYAKSLTVSGVQRWLLWLSCLCSYALVLLGNVTAGTLPLLLPVYELLFVNKERRVLSRYPIVCGMVVVVLTTACGYYYAQHTDFQRALLKTYVQNGFTGTQDYLPMFMVAFKAPVLYLKQLLWPFALAPEYVVTFSKDLLQWGSVAGVFLLTGMLVSFWTCRKSAPVLSFAVAWCLLLYLPVANFLPVHAYSMADRYLYMLLPGVGFALAILLQKVSSPLLNKFFVIVLIGLSLLTIVQNTHWKNEYSLWSHAVTVNPESKGAIWSMGQAYLVAGEFPEAKEAFKQVLAIDRFSVKAYLELAKLQELEGDISEAKKNYQLFVRYGQYQFPAEAMKVKAYLQYKYR